MISFSLIEFVIVLFLLTLFSGFSFMQLSHSPLPLLLSQYSAGIYLRSLRHHGMSTGSDLTVSTDTHSLFVNTDFPSFHFFSPLKVSINGRSKLGFTQNGHTKYAGTLLLSQPFQEKRITLPPGDLGRISLK